MRAALFILSFIGFSVHAAEVADTEFSYWQELGLNQSELVRYERLTETPGLVSKTIQDDPLLVLGIYAQSEQQQEHFARLYLRRELDRAEREIAFFRAYSDLFNSEFGDRALVDLAALGIQPSGSTLDRLTVLVQTDCAACTPLVKAIGQRIASGDLAGVDLYIADVKHDSAIQAWARRLDLTTTLIESGQITLNLGAALAKQLSTTAYPAVFKRRGDRLERLSLSERLALLGPRP